MLAERDFEKITINSIVSKAGIGRSTFYLHFQDKFDLLNYVSNLIVSELQALYQQPGANQSIELFRDHYSHNEPLPSCITIAEHFLKFAGFYRNRLQNNRFYQELAEGLKVQLIAFYNDDFLASFAAYGTIDIMNQWLEQQMSMPLREITLRLTNIGLHSLFGLAAPDERQALRVAAHA
ncbi:TetR/AcrR family transcriptional regulator [Paenibacillus sp. GCM10027626]|uniref:TetR/AcrR family transcriptional regulator n=1 Tax=Paenibacillus sp. GCM10027626 TaxID=3273411 RepID=UPI003625F6DB